MGGLMLASCGGGGGGGSSTSKGVTITGQVKTSYVEGLKVCVANTTRCTYTNKDGIFKLTANLPATINFYLNSTSGNLIWASYEIRNNNEVITPLKITNGNKTLAKFIGGIIHALCNDTTDSLEYLTLKGISITSIEDSKGNRLNISNLETFLKDTLQEISIKYVDQRNEEKTIKINPSNATIQLCYQNTCKNVNYNPVNYKWTIIILYDGDNNLDPYVDKDIQELQKVLIPSDIKIVGLADYKYKNGGFIYETNDTTGKYEFVKEISEPNMGDPNYLAQFLEEYFNKYPSQYRAIIMWDHGFAWKSPSSQYKLMAIDDTNNSYLYSYKFVQMLQNLHSENININLIGFDECLMGNTEVFWDIANYTDYMVGSELLEPANGWDYTLVFSKLANNINATPQEFAHYIVDAYAEAYANQNDITMIAASSQEIKNLVDNLNKLVSKFNPQDSTVVDIFQQARNNAYDIYTTGDYCQNHQLIDLYSFLVGLKDYYSEAQSALNLIQKMYKKIIGNNQVHGLSIYFPNDINCDDKDYYCTSPFQCNGYYNPFTSTNWDEFLQEYLSATSSQ